MAAPVVRELNTTSPVEPPSPPHGVLDFFQIAMCNENFKGRIFFQRKFLFNFCVAIIAFISSFRFKLQVEFCFERYLHEIILNFEMFHFPIFCLKEWTTRIGTVRIALHRRRHRAVIWNQHQHYKTFLPYFSSLN